jgi:hypothetical protein
MPEEQERPMKITGPELVLIAGTRGLLGVGIGLLLAGKMSGEQRRAVGRTLMAIGAATTLPLALQVFRRKEQLPTMST